jgi:hypothetical protein
MQGLALEVEVNLLILPLPRRYEFLA